MSDPVSWFLIEPGWEVVGADGENVGKVHEVVGDSAARHLRRACRSTAGLLAEAQYVPAEEVGRITEGRVQLTAR